MKLDSFLGSGGKFLLIGEPGPELAALKACRWTGIAITPPGTWKGGSLLDEEYFAGISYVEAVVSPDPHFVKLVQGYWVRPITIKEVFDQWGGSRFDLICIADIMLARTLWCTDQIQAHFPRYGALRDDGNNTAIMQRAGVRGYSHDFLDDGILFFHRNGP